MMTCAITHKLSLSNAWVRQNSQELNKRLVIYTSPFNAKSCWASPKNYVVGVRHHNSKASKHSRQG